MRSVVVILRELLGLFVDDGALALQIVAVVALAWMSSVLFPNTPLAAGVILIAGCIGALLVSVLRVVPKHTAKRSL